MSVGWTLVALALLPVAAWLLAVAVVAVRRWLRRRGDESTRRLRLARMLRRADVDLPEHTVLEVAAEAGMRFLGYERPDTLLRRRVGVFVRVGGPVDRAIRGSGAEGSTSTTTVPAGRPAVPR